MKKLIIISGSPDSGKTLSVNLAIKKLLASGAIIEKYLFDTKENFWERKGGGAIIVSYSNSRIAIISYGDTVDAVSEVLENVHVLNCDILVCCSHSTRGKKVFDYVHNYIKAKVDLTKTKIVPIHKNFLCNYGKETVENECTANLILELI